MTFVSSSHFTIVTRFFEEETRENAPGVVNQLFSKLLGCKKSGQMFEMRVDCIKIRYKIYGCRVSMAMLRRGVYSFDKSQPITRALRSSANAVSKS